MTELDAFNFQELKVGYGYNISYIGDLALNTDYWSSANELKTYFKLETKATIYAIGWLGKKGWAGIDGTRQSLFESNSTLGEGSLLLGKVFEPLEIQIPIWLGRYRTGVLTDSELVSSQEKINQFIYARKGIAIRSDREPPAANKGSSNSAAAGDNDRILYGHYSSLINVSEKMNNQRRFGLRLRCPYPFWVAKKATESSLTLSGGAPASKTISIPFNAGNYAPLVYNLNIASSITKFQLTITRNNKQVALLNYDTARFSIDNPVELPFSPPFRDAWEIKPITTIADLPKVENKYGIWKGYNSLFYLEEGNNYSFTFLNSEGSGEVKIKYFQSFANP